MKVKEFREERSRLTQLCLDKANLNIKRFFALDHAAYDKGEIPPKYKEMMGLVASLVLRCDDCICYHLDQCQASGVSETELNEAMNIALVVGGSIVIPHLRRAMAYWEELAGLSD
ncbi:MAG: carboxymuconolactone decarboxylase family protein [Candidatus Cloacimonadaceae bacterium]|jgi:AhpD family alkylhydroperoxidase|nr:carboxymuconolactone decarboxylase family protein [Candidatus Cloacimonadota bacterium]MDY0127966.1 carboxymuconolactone decarboxylase family protein [Candidatus Cloacimonadaceae bacterium]MCB5254974.1 carboxymuconolactone decarboxylase family protein [Candidatus Cloacimonadota bacterium]MCK9178683.1 carboxymuconolactone decarboxylase family protein [Candidatus Cloacimonadota bacterium]MCK9242772.1 carboxymuconolactone decarboxylase family protein [Candidatus Cloacimonadota bacterium]